MLMLGRSRCIATTETLNTDGSHVVEGRLLAGYVNALVMAAALRVPSTVFARDCLDFLKLNIATPVPSLNSLTARTMGNVGACPCLLFLPTLLVDIVVLTFGLLKSKLHSTFSPGLGGWEEMGVLDRGLLRVGSRGLSFFAPTNRIGTLGNISFSVSRNRILKVINRSNSKGSIATCSVVKLATCPNGLVNKAVEFGNRRVRGVASGSFEGVEKGRISVVFRSPVADLGPICAVNGRVARIVELRASGSGGRTCRHTGRLLRLMNVGRPAGHLGRCPRRLSNNVHREIVVTVTLTYRPGLLVTSRPAATLSIAVRTRVLSLVRSLHGGLKVDVVVVARSLNIITDVYRGVTIVCTNRVIRCNATSRVFCRPGRRCAGNLVGSVPGLGIRDGRELMPVRKRPISLLGPPTKYPFTPEYSGYVGVYLGRVPPGAILDSARCDRY